MEIKCTAKELKELLGLSNKKETPVAGTTIASLKDLTFPDRIEARSIRLH